MDNRMWNLFRQAKKVRLDRHTVTRTSMDDHIADEMIERASRYRGYVENPPVIEGNDDKTREYVPHWDDLMHDIFVSYHGVDAPGVLTQDAVKQSREPNRRVMGQMVGTEEHQHTRSMTRGDATASAFATMKASNKASDLLQGEMREMAEQAQAAGRQENQVANAQDALDQIREEVAEQGGQATDEQKADMRQAAKKKRNAAQRLAKISQDMQDTVTSQAVASAVKEAAKEGEKAARTISNLPGTGPGERQKMNIDQALHLAELFHENDVLRKAADILGRLLRDMKFKRARRVTGGTEEIVDVTVGDDLEHLLVSELMKLRHPLLKREFYKNFHEKSLLQYELQGTTEVGFGPIGIACDRSSSMKKDARYIWAIAVKLALLAIAHREKRDVFVVNFNTSHTTWYFPYRETIDPQKLADMAADRPSGGTDIDLALRECVNVIDNVPKFQRGDVVILSDGKDTYAQESEKIRQEFSDKGIRCHGIQIGADVGPYLDKMCDETASAYDLAGPNKATDMLATAVG